MQDDEEFKSQCWGGGYMSEVFDHMLKRMSYRRQKRWWNAYMLFYCRADLESGLDQSGLDRDMEGLSVGGKGVHSQPKMPKPIERSILKQNVKFLHNRFGGCFIIISLVTFVSPGTSSLQNTSHLCGS